MKYMLRPQLEIYIDLDTPSVAALCPDAQSNGLQDKSGNSVQHVAADVPLTEPQGFKQFVSSVGSIPETVEITVVSAIGVMKAVTDQLLELDEEIVSLDCCHSMTGMKYEWTSDLHDSIRQDRIALCTKECGDGTSTLFELPSLTMISKASVLREIWSIDESG